MRTCSTCAEVFGDEVLACPHDGTRLTDWQGDHTERGLGPTDRTAAPQALGLGGRLLGGRYRLKKQIGVGGFGAVFEAEDTRLEKRVAVKLLSPKVATEPEALARFRQEALAASRVGHKGIVDVTDFDRDADGTQFIVMEYLDGCDLSRMIDKDGPLPPGQALAIAVQVAHALGAAHAKGILHRDLKPANIYLTTIGAGDDFVKILDFGISKVINALTGTAGLTSTGQIIGTPYYMAPEQASGERAIDGRVDVYSLGIILYEMLLKFPPFRGNTPLAVITQHLTREPQPPTKALPALELPAELDPLVLRALAKDPDRRYESMAVFAETMLSVLERIDPEAATVLRPRRLRSEPGLRRSAPGLAVEEAFTPTVSEAGLVHSTLGRASGELAVSSSARRSRVVLGAGLAVAGVAATIVIAGLAARQPRPVSLAAAVTEERAPDAAPLATYDATPAPTPPVPATRAAAPSATLQQVETTASRAPDMVEIGLRLTPSDARVELDGELVTALPLHLRAGTRHRLVISAPGHATARRTLRADASRELVIALPAGRRRHAGPKGGLSAPPMEDDL